MSRKGFCNILVLAVMTLLLGGTGWAEAPALKIKGGPLGLTSVAAAPPGAQAKEPFAKEKVKLSEDYGKLPLYFIKNTGQLDKKVRFYEKGGGHSTFFTKDGVYLSLTKGKNGADGPVIARSASDEAISGGARDGIASPPASEGKGGAAELIKLSLIGSKKNPKITAVDEQSGKVNYFVGKDKSKWRTNVPTYGAVLYEGVYKGVDVRYYGNNRQLEYDVVVKPGSDPKNVKFAYEGIKGLTVLQNGDLEIDLYEGSI